MRTSSRIQKSNFNPYNLAMFFTVFKPKKVILIKGIIITFKPKNGYGFIKVLTLNSKYTNSDVFFHINDTDISEDLIQEYCDVEFDIQEAQRGPRAINIKLK